MRLVYFVYYLKNCDYSKLNNFQMYVRSLTGDGKLSQWASVFFNSLKYNISIFEYYQFRFWEKNHTEKLSWAGTGYMYEFQKKMNPLDMRNILDDKREFFKKYSKFFIHNVYSLDTIKDNPLVLNELFNSSKFVFKVADGKCGVGVAILPKDSFNKEKIISFMESNGYDLVESYIEQHTDLQQLSPTAVNTVRIFTQLNSENKADILGCRLRISVNCEVDNMAAGNLAASIDENSGILNGPGVYSDITKVDEKIHPITGTPIVGFQVPFWSECLKLAKDAAIEHPQNRSIGWDIVVTPNGPGLIEGNHDWCKLVWQLPVKKGLKSKLMAYVS